jgi:hypothetical protein
MSIGTQRNGVPVEVKSFDTIGMHDFSNTSQWPSPLDSSWVIDPSDGYSEYHNSVLKLTELQLDLSENLIIHEGGELLVEFFINGVPNPVFTYTYKSISDWISRANEKKKIDYNGLIGPFMQFNVMFAKPPWLWTSTGIDAAGNYKLNKMVIRIADNQPYKNSEGNPAKICLGRYFAEIYEDPDV